MRLRGSRTTPASPPINPPNAPRAHRRIRAYLRKHHVPCPSCGYDLHRTEIIACPECSWLIQFQKLLPPATIAPAANAARVRGYLRRRHVPCPACGYDLHRLETPVCPECSHQLSILELIARHQPRPVRTVSGRWYQGFAVAQSLAPGYAAVIVAVVDPLAPLTWLIGIVSLIVIHAIACLELSRTWDARPASQRAWHRMLWPNPIAGALSLLPWIAVVARFIWVLSR